MEFDHHGAVHFGAIHIVDALHADEILIVRLLLNVHHVLITICILILSVTIIQMLVDRNVLEMVLILLLAAESKLGALVQLVCVAFPGNVHHYEVFAQLILIRLVQPHGFMIQLTVILHNYEARCILLIYARAANSQTHELLLILVVFGTLVNAVGVTSVSMVLSCIQGCGGRTTANDSCETSRS